MITKVIDLNDLNFKQEVISSGGPVVVHFWAGWCQLCQTITPWLETVADGGTVPVKVARVNVEDHEALTEEYGVRAVPTLLIFDQGVVREQIIGRTTERDVRESLERLG